MIFALSVPMDLKCSLFANFPNGKKQKEISFLKQEQPINRVFLEDSSMVYVALKSSILIGVTAVMWLETYETLNSRYKNVCYGEMVFKHNYNTTTIQMLAFNSTAHFAFKLKSCRINR